MLVWEVGDAVFFEESAEKGDAPAGGFERVVDVDLKLEIQGGAGSAVADW